MTHEELSTLCDIYQTLNSDFRQKQTSYVLQTIWRDLTSEVFHVPPRWFAHTLYMLPISLILLDHTTQAMGVLTTSFFRLL